MESVCHEFFCLAQGRGGAEKNEVQTHSKTLRLCVSASLRLRARYNSSCSRARDLRAQETGLMPCILTPYALMPLALVSLSLSSIAGSPQIEDPAFRGRSDKRNGIMLVCRAAQLNPLKE